MKKRVLVYPCGTEIALEIYRAIHNDKDYQLVGGSSTYDHGRFVYKNHIDDLPFISDESTLDEVISFNKHIEGHDIDLIYPAMDGVLTVFSKYRGALTPIVAAPEFLTCEITRSKSRTYETVRAFVKTPVLYEDASGVSEFPVFVKPDVGQGSVNAKRVNSRDELDSILQVNCGKMIICEFLPGEECTVDCYTNADGRLVFCVPRRRKRIKNGISVNAYRVDVPELYDMAVCINSLVKQVGGWFFQVKQDKDLEYRLLEVSSRIGGASAFSRFLGVNLPLLTVNEHFGRVTTDVIANDCEIELDRALYNSCRSNLDFTTAYVDFDDTIVIDGKLNIQVISFIYECINKNRKVILLTRHKGDLYAELKKFKISELFSEIIWIRDETDEKTAHIKYLDAVFIDDSYGERKKVHDMFGIPVFDVHNVECLKEERD